MWKDSPSRSNVNRANIQTLPTLVNVSKLRQPWESCCRLVFEAVQVMGQQLE